MVISTCSVWFVHLQIDLRMPPIFRWSGWTRQPLDSAGVLATPHLKITSRRGLMTSWLNGPMSMEHFCLAFLFVCVLGCIYIYQFSSVQDDIYELWNQRKAHMHSTSSHRSFPNVALETVPMLVGLTMALSHPLKEDRWALPLSTPLSSRWSIVWCPWLCARR